jgi:hypothetical protein
MKLSRWAPASVRILRHYSLSTFAHDLGAGVTVGLVALPLAMAFAIASGLTPQAGIYCAIITGFLISLLGGSRYQIGGPTGAFVVVVAGIVAEFGVSGLYMVTIPPPRRGAEHLPEHPDGTHARRRTPPRRCGLRPAEFLESTDRISTETRRARGRAEKTA